MVSLGHWVDEEQIGLVVAEGMRSSVLAFLSLRNLPSTWPYGAGGWISRSEAHGKVAEPVGGT